MAAETFKEPTQREDAKKQIKKVFEDRYASGNNKWFFQPLRVRARASTRPVQIDLPCPSSELLALVRRVIGDLKTATCISHAYS